MSSIIDQMLACSVIVAGGSGVLIQPMSSAYSYILTAKHVIEEYTDNINKVRVEKIDGTIITINDYLIDPVHDIAILKTSEAIPSELSRCIDDVEVDEKLYLLGYPNTRRNEPNYRDKTRDFDGQTTARVENDFFSVNLKGQPNFDELQGISGCGVFRQIEKTIYLCGIEFRVEGKSSIEYHGRVQCVPLSKFDELIAKHSENYERILPPYLLSFSEVKERTFGFKGVGTPESLTFLKSVLHNTIQIHIANQTLPTPIELYKKYKATLLIYQSPAEDAFNIKLWIALLEFMIITSIIEDQQPVDINVLEKQESKRKFLFSATEEAWNMLLHKIFLSDLRGLGTNGKVIIDAGRCDGLETPSELTLNRVISNIGRHDGADLRIDAPMKNPAKEFKYYHWQGVHKKCVIEKEDDYAEFNTYIEGKDATAVLAKLRDDYAKFLG